MNRRLQDIASVTLVILFYVAYVLLYVANIKGMLDYWAAHETFTLRQAVVFGLKFIGLYVPEFGAFMGLIDVGASLL